MVFISNDMQLPNHSLTFIHENKSLHSSLSILARSDLAYNTIASSDKLNCTNFVDFAKYQIRFGQFSWSNNDSNYLDVKLNVFKKNDNKVFRLVKYLPMGAADFKQFMRLRNQLVIAAENFVREENLSPVLIPTISKDMDEQLKLAHKLVEVVDRANKKVCSTLLRYNVEKPLCSSLQGIIFKEERECEVSTNCVCAL